MLRRSLVALFACLAVFAVAAVAQEQNRIYMPALSAAAPTPTATATEAPTAAPTAQPTPLPWRAPNTRYVPLTVVAVGQVGLSRVNVTVRNDGPVAVGSVVFTHSYFDPTLTVKTDEKFEYADPSVVIAPNEEQSIIFLGSPPAPPYSVVEVFGIPVGQ